MDLERSGGDFCPSTAFCQNWKGTFRFISLIFFCGALEHCLKDQFVTGYYPFPSTKIRWPLSVEEAGSKKEKNFVFFCLPDWGGERGRLQSLSSLLSPPQSRRQKKNNVGASLLNAQRSPDFGQWKRIITQILWFVFVTHKHNWVLDTICSIVMYYQDSNHNTQHNTTHSNQHELPPLPLPLPLPPYPPAA